MYGAFKAAAWSVTNPLRLELARQNTQVVGVHARFIETEKTAALDVAKANRPRRPRGSSTVWRPEAPEVLADEATVANRAALSGPHRAHGLLSRPLTAHPLIRKEYRTAMPLWTIYHTSGIFTDIEKHQLAAHIADHYEQVGLPRFYVVTVFHEAGPEDFYVGGEPISAGVRIAIDHIARRAADAESRQRNAQWITGMLRPHLERKAGLHWEFHVDETSDDLWMINGIAPPPAGSDAERLWAESNAVSPY